MAHSGSLRQACVDVGQRPAPWQDLRPPCLDVACPPMASSSSPYSSSVRRRRIGVYPDTMGLGFCRQVRGRRAVLDSILCAHSPCMLNARYERSCSRCLSPRPPAMCGPISLIRFRARCQRGCPSLYHCMGLQAPSSRVAGERPHSCHLRNATNKWEQALAWMHELGLMTFHGQLDRSAQLAPPALQDCCSGGRLHQCLLSGSRHHFRRRCGGLCCACKRHSEMRSQSVVGSLDPHTSVGYSGWVQRVRRMFRPRAVSA